MDAQTDRVSDAYIGGFRDRAASACFNLLSASMALALLARNGVLFLLAWETMSLASFFLVAFEDEKESVREAAWTYMVAAHLGTAFLLVMFVMLGGPRGSMEFGALAANGSSSAIFLLAMINERQREFGAMRALGANLHQLRRFLFAEAATIGALSLVIGAGVGAALARLLVMLLAVVFTIPAQGLAWPGLELLALAGFVVAGMLASTFLSARRLATLKVVEALREL
jgi:ABC-type lipoprotein release transport system permease subunit